VCPITATLTPSLPYITLSPDFTTILLDGSQASDLDNGTHLMTLKVDNLLFPASVTQAVYTFVVDLQACVVNNFNFATTIADFTYMLSSLSMSSAAATASQSNLNCLFPITYSATYALLGSPIPEPACIQFNPAARTFTVNTQSKSDVGVYSIIVTATIPQVLAPGGTISTSFTLLVTIESDCKLSTITDRLINDMTCQISTLYQ
jgi:hypothetical protein